jgi:2-aminoadipate transaminase
MPPFPDWIHRTPTDAADLAEMLRRAIDGGRIAAGERLPTIRAAAERFGMPRKVVQAAYRTLAEDRYVASTVGRGTEVLAREGAADRRGVGSPERSDLGPRAHAVLQQFAGVRQAAQVVPSIEDGGQVRADLRQLLPDPSSFPVAEFGEAIERALGRRGGALLEYGDAQGDPELREWLAGIDPSARAAGRELVVTTGAQHGIDLVLRVTCGPGETVVCSSPTYSQLPGSLAVNGLRSESLDWRVDGFDLDGFERLCRGGDVRLLYVMPSFQNPAGTTLDRSTRDVIAELCERHDVLILEDDFQGGLRFEGEDLPTLGELAPDRTATVRTLSKGLFPGLRIGWVSAPARWIAAMTAMRRFADLETSPLLQAALYEFGRDGHLESHYEETRRELRARHTQLQASLSLHMPDGASWTRPEGGYTAWVELPLGTSGVDVARRAALDGVYLTPGSVFGEHERALRGLRLSVSRTPVECLDEAVRTLSDQLRPAATLGVPGDVIL